MYLGLMKRGLSLMILAGAFGICMLELGSFLFVVPFLIVMAYSFFDTYHLRDALKRGEAPADEYLVKSNLFKNLRGNRLVGVGVLLIGVYLLLTKTLGELVNNYFWNETLEHAYWTVRRCLPSLIASCLTIGIGLKMIVGNREEE